MALVGGHFEYNQEICGAGKSLHMNAHIIYVLYLM